MKIADNGKTLYIADRDNYRIRKLNLDPTSSEYLMTSLVIGSGLNADTAGTYM